MSLFNLVDELQTKVEVITTKRLNDIGKADLIGTYEHEQDVAMLLDWLLQCDDVDQLLDPDFTLGFPDEPAAEIGVDENGAAYVLPFTAD